jgi:hypothetical protein
LEDGRRVSSRVHRKPLEWYRNEYLEYSREHKSECDIPLLLVEVMH